MERCLLAAVGGGWQKFAAVGSARQSETEQGIVERGRGSQGRELWRARAHRERGTLCSDRDRVRHPAGRRRLKKTRDPQ